MTSVAIHRMTNRFRMPVSAWPERARIGRIFDTAMFDMLEHAIVDAGLDPRDEICIRRVTVFVRLHLRGTDHSLARAWSAAWRWPFAKRPARRNPTSSRSGRARMRLPMS